MTIIISLLDFLVPRAKHQSFHVVTGHLGLSGWTHVYHKAIAGHGHFDYTNQKFLTLSLSILQWGEN